MSSRIALIQIMALCLSLMYLYTSFILEESATALACSICCISGCKTILASTCCHQSCHINVILSSVLQK